MTIKLEDYPDSEKIFSNGAATEFGMIQSRLSGTNRCFPILINMPAKSHRTLRIRGSPTWTNWLTLSVLEYRKGLSLPHAGAQDTRWDLYLLDSKILPYLPDFARTNMTLIHSTGAATNK